MTERILIKHFKSLSTLSSSVCVRVLSCLSYQLWQLSLGGADIKQG